MADVIPLFELFMQDWENLARKKPQYRAAIEAGLAVAIKHYKRMDNTDAYVIAMCKFLVLRLRVSDVFRDVVLHPLYRMEHVKEFWDHPYDDRAEEAIKKKVSALPIEV